MRAFWLGSALQSLCGALIGGLLGGLFHLFFGEDIEILHNAPDAEAVIALADKLLTLETEPELLHNVYHLFSMRTDVRVTFSVFAVCWPNKLMIDMCVHVHVRLCPNDDLHLLCTL